MSSLSLQIFVNRALSPSVTPPHVYYTDFRVTKPTDIEAFMLFLTFVTAP